jgi:hypothetical protein
VTQLIVTISPFVGPPKGTVCGVLKAPIVLDEPELMSQVELADIATVDGPDRVLRTGKLLAERIRANINVCKVLDHALQRPEGLPIYLRVGEALAHGLTWEALVGNERFFALERSPIARIARGITQEPGAQQSFAGNLRLVAVLSAVQNPAKREWQGLWRAVEDARADGLPVDLIVFAAEEELIEELTGLPGVTVKPVPSSAGELIDDLRSLEPHLLHLYCHGSTEDKVGLLHIGTITDFDRDDGVSSVVINANELGHAIAEAGTWAIVLNACEGAAAGGEQLTLAETLVNEGVPVAVGMRRLIDASDAHVFSAAFYPAVFAAVGQAALAPVGASTTLEWANTLQRARRDLRDKHGAKPERHDAWTLPVLYTREGPFTLSLAARGDELTVTHAVAESDTVGGLIDVLPDSAPPALLQELRELAPPPP